MKTRTRPGVWPWALPTAQIVDAIAACPDIDEALDRGWEWARGTRDACLEDNDMASTSWNRAAEVVGAVAVYRQRVSE